MIPSDSVFAHEAARAGKSKMKINSMFSILQKQDYIEQKTRGKYVLTDKAENIIETIETLQ